MNVFIFLLCFFSFAYRNEAAVTVSSSASTYTGGSTQSLTFTNTDYTAVCAVTFTVSLPSGTYIASYWNMNNVSGSSTQFTLPTWINIAANGGTYTSTGFTLSGSGTPTLTVNSYTACSSSTTTTTAASATTTTTTAGTTTTTTSSATTTTASSGTTTTTTASSSSNTKVVATDSTNAALNSCYASTATGVITSYMNTAYTGEFTFYGAGGTGACGLNSGLPDYSAAASGALFSSSAQWIAPCTGSQYILNDAICINKCVKITYTCVGCTSAKTLTVPINNKCPECAYNHVDLSEDAFNWLEPEGGTVGVATGAIITYIECP